MACELEIIALAESEAAYTDHIAAATVFYAQYLTEYQLAMTALSQVESNTQNLEYCLYSNGGSGSGSGTGSGSGGGSSSGGGGEQRIMAPIEQEIDRVHRHVQVEDAKLLLRKCEATPRRLANRIQGRPGILPPVIIGPRMRAAMKAIRAFCDKHQ